MAQSFSPRTALLLIDVQLGFSDENFWGPRSTPSFETNLTHLLAAARASNRDPKILVIHVHHHSVHPQSPLYSQLPGSASQPYALPQPGEVVFTKTVNSAFIGTDLEAYLRQNQIGRLFRHCVSTSVRMVNNLKVCKGQWGDGEIFIVKDACAAHAAGRFDAETVHAVNIATLDGEFCTAVSTEEACSIL
ncbi:isochorismatase hydrolase [Auriculariales sp. MPI-PUGE-AT-0066]|nr:isochorismatase hydrolase [Auriculariales sp. MPI-PUGE-AT-0066]